MPPAYFQYQRKAEPVTVPSAAEDITLDKWLGLLPGPQARRRTPLPEGVWTPEHSPAEGAALDWFRPLDRPTPPRPLLPLGPSLAFVREEPAAAAPDLVSLLPQYTWPRRPQPLTARTEPSIAVNPPLASAAYGTSGLLRPRRRLQFQAVGGPVFVPRSTTWATIFPDQLLPARRVPQFPALAFYPEPVALAIAEQAWRPTYPDQHLRHRRVVEFLAHVLNAFPRPDPVSDLTFPGWLGVYPDRASRRDFLPPLQQAFATGALAPSFPITTVQWLARFPDWLWRRALPVALIPAAQGPSPSPIVAAAPPELSWMPRYPARLDPGLFPWSSIPSIAEPVEPETDPALLMTFWWRPPSEPTRRPSSLPAILADLYPPDLWPPQAADLLAWQARYPERFPARPFPPGVMVPPVGLFDKGSIGRGIPCILLRDVRVSWAQILDEATEWARLLDETDWWARIDDDEVC